ncbi:major facilitator superfamily domain-containing protein [Hysterangium stoloniferum]|nr:major facilitator superfamily domain-containing protein [Hysterangium stoloniferum]
MNSNDEDKDDFVRRECVSRIDMVEKIGTNDSSGFNPPSSAELVPFDLPPDGGLTAWLVVLACFLLNFNILGIHYSSAHYLLHQFADDSAELISFIGTTLGTLLILIGFPASKFIDMYGFRPVSVVGSILFSGGLVMAGFCRTVPTLVVTQGVVVGIGAGMLYIPASIGPVQWFLKRRSFAIGLSSAGAGIGGIFWSFFTRVIISKLGYQRALWLSGAVSAGINIIALFMFKSRPSRGGPTNYLVPFLYVPTYAQTQLKTNPLVGSVLAGIMDLGVVFGRIILGMVADSRVGALNATITGMMLAGIFHFVLWLPAANSLPLFMVPVVLVRIFDPDQLTSIMGVFFTSQIPGQLAGGPIAGAIFSHTHRYWTPVIIYSGMTLFCGSLFAVATRFQIERRVFVTI